jgi:choline dehydrogenase
VVVVGGGIAGCVVASRLSENPDCAVCLVEAGPDYGPYDEGRWPEDILDARSLALDSHRWTQTDPDDRSQARARVLGGCSSHNACALVRGEPADYDEWGSGWTNAELEPYFDRAERSLGAYWFPREDLSPWHRAFADACRDETIEHPFNLRGTVRWNAAFAYLDPARTRANLTILGDTIVDRLEDGRVVTPRGTFAARTVALAAGAYGTPGVLLRSGIGPGLEHDLPVGENLADHVGVGMAWDPTGRCVDEVAAHEAAHPLYMAGATIRARSGRDPAGLPDLFFFPGLDPGPEISAAVFAMKPRSRGSVRLTSADPEAALAIDHGFLRDPHDADVLTAGFQQLRALAAREPVSLYAGRERRPGERVGSAEHVRTAARGFFHPVGTAAMGSVVDSGCRVLGLDEVVVVDASMMPTIPRANTALTVAAVAERLAESLQGA